MGSWFARVVRSGKRSKRGSAAGQSAIRAGPPVTELFLDTCTTVRSRYWEEVLCPHQLVACGGGSPPGGVDGVRGVERALPLPDPLLPTRDNRFERRDALVSTVGVVDAALVVCLAHVALACSQTILEGGNRESNDAPRKQDL